MHPFPYSPLLNLMYSKINSHVNESEDIDSVDLVIL